MRLLTPHAFGNGKSKLGGEVLSEVIKIDTVILDGVEVIRQAAIKILEKCNECESELMFEIISSDGNSGAAIMKWCNNPSFYYVQYKTSNRTTYGAYKDTEENVEAGEGWEDDALRQRLQGIAENRPFIDDQVILYLHAISVACYDINSEQFSMSLE